MHSSCADGACKRSRRWNEAENKSSGLWRKQKCVLTMGISVVFEPMQLALPQRTIVMLARVGKPENGTLECGSLDHSDTLA